MGVVFEWDVGVSEVAGGDAFELSVEESFEAGDGGFLSEIESMEEKAEAGGIDEAVESFGKSAFWGILAPGPAVAFEFFRGHAPIGAVAVQEEMTAEAALEFVKMEEGIL